MTQYSKSELEAIVLDSFAELSYKVKYTATEGFAFSRPQQKYSDYLIKTVGDSVYNKVRENFYSEEYRRKILSALEKGGITCVTYFSTDYPVQLKNIPAPPLVLYCRGNASLLSRRMFGVVGSRRTQTAALRLCGKLSGQIAEKFVVVTGTADGADTAAAEGAVESGNLICVAAQGLDKVYPASAAALYKRVAERGLLISEQLPDTLPRSYLFPVRNRIIAALCDGVLVVSAGEKSGAAITAEYAFEYGKDVFCLPYPPGSPTGAGCNRLIKKGAYLAENILDIFGAFGLDFNSRREPQLSDVEKKLLSVIRDRGEAHISELAAALCREPYELLADISSLEIKKCITRLGGNRYGAL